MTSEEKARRLRRVYALLTRLAEESEATPTETLTGTKAGVADGDADERQPHPELYQGGPIMQETGGGT